MKLSAELLLNPTEQTLLVDAIRKAELLSSGEIRVHLENYTNKDVFTRASELFFELNMHETENRNGVLIYVAVEQHKFSIIGDEGIHSFVHDEFWEKQAVILKQYFKENCFLEGLSKVVCNIGLELKEHFPLGDDNPNELTNEISFG